MKAKRITSKNELVLKSLFWDIDVEKVDFNKNRKFIIERILKYGLPEQVAWLLDNYTEKYIIEVVKISKNIDKKTANYWAIHFHIPKEEILCLKRPLMQDCFY